MILRNSPSKSLSEINLFPHATMLLTWHVNHFLKFIPLLAIWWHFTSAVTKLPSDYIRISPNLPKPILNNINSNYVDIISGHGMTHIVALSEHVQHSIDVVDVMNSHASFLFTLPKKDTKNSYYFSLALEVASINQLNQLPVPLAQLYIVYGRPQMPSLSRAYLASLSYTISWLLWNWSNGYNTDNGIIPTSAVITKVFFQYTFSQAKFRN